MYSYLYKTDMHNFDNYCCMKSWYLFDPTPIANCKSNKRQDEHYLEYV